MTQAKKRGAPRGNKNRVITNQTERKRGANTNLSMSHETWELFKTACELHEGGALSEEEYKERWREICRGAVSAFISRHNTALVDPSVYIQ